LALGSRGLGGGSVPDPRCGEDLKGRRYESLGARYKSLGADCAKAASSRRTPKDRGDHKIESFSVE